jgi:hypothetical protein
VYCCSAVFRTVPAFILFLLLSVLSPRYASASSESCDCTKPIATQALLIQPGARELSLGGAGVAGARGPTASYYNPALLSWQSQNESTVYPYMLGSTYFSVPHESGFGDKNYTYIPAVFIIADWGQFSVSVTYLRLGEQFSLDERGRIRGRFMTYSSAFSLGYSRKVGEKMSAGITLKRYHDHLTEHAGLEARGDPSGSGLAFDIGMAYRFTTSLMVGAALRNYGPNVTYIDASQSSPMPVNFNIGAAWKLLDTQSHEITFVGDIYKPLAQDFTRSWYLAPIRGWYDEDIYRVDRVVQEDGTRTRVERRSTFRAEIRQVDTHFGSEYGWRGMAFLRMGWFRDWDESQVEDGQGFRYGAGIRTTLWRVRIEADVARIESDASELRGDRTAFSLVLAI